LTAATETPLARVDAGIAVANAPCSYGAFEETVERDPLVPTPASVLEQVAAAGYAGIDLGPPGYLGDASAIGDALATRNLTLAGGFMPLSFGDPDLLASEIAHLHELLDIFDAAGSWLPAPKPTLADAGTPSARLMPAAARDAAGQQRSTRWWQAYAAGVRLATHTCRERGYDPTFHHHIGGQIESPQEIDRLLELTDIALCLDNGHLAVAGGDAVEGIRRWGERINHVHMKDADTAAVDALVQASAPVEELWEQQVFRPLGKGQLGCDQVLDALDEIGYRGWLVVEQDIFPQRGSLAEKAKLDQEVSRAYLRQRGL
jgi:inosose dehydratase